MATIDITSFQFSQPFGLKIGQKYQVVDQAGKPDYIYQGNGNWVRTRDDSTDVPEVPFVKDNKIPLYAIPSDGGVKVLAGEQDITSQIVGNGGASAWEKAAQIFATRRDTAGVKFAALGDSITSWPGTYAQITGIYGSPASTMPWTSIAALDLAAQSPGWVPASSAWSATYVQAAWTANGGVFPLGNFHVPNLQTKKSVDPTINLPVYTVPGIDLCNRVTIYYLARTNANAPIFRVTINGAQTATIDTYEPPVSFGSVLVNQSVPGIIKATTIPLTTPARTVAITLDQMTLIDRGSGVGTDGTQVIFGVDIGGGGVDHRNYAVSSTTLLDASAANGVRGVTTSERVGLAKAYGANVFMIGWGTNDSKTGISTPAAYRSQLNALLDDIAVYSADALTILFAPPQGAWVYANNQIYADEMRSVAAARGVPLLDARDIFDSAGSVAYADDVHPSQAGRVLLARELVRLLGGRTASRAV